MEYDGSVMSAFGSARGEEWVSLGGWFKEAGPQHLFDGWSYPAPPWVSGRLICFLLLSSPFPSFQFLRQDFSLQLRMASNT